MSIEPLVVDVRDDLRSGREPFPKIMSGIDSLGPDQDMLLYATFEPVPLIRVLERKGFTHTSREIGGGDWEVRFHRSDG